jgi:hypothetical protein
MEELPRVPLGIYLRQVVWVWAVAVVTMLGLLEALQGQVELLALLGRVLRAAQAVMVLVEEAGVALLLLRRRVPEVLGVRVFVLRSPYFRG